MRIITYNVHSCRGLDGRVAPERIAKVIASTRADVACLQELDAGRARTGRVRQAAAVAEALKMQFEFFPAIRAAGEEYGDAILSRHPMKLLRAAELPRPIGALEPRGALWVEIEAEGTSWQVITTHLGLGRGTRRAQARALAQWISEASNRLPLVFCGDLNSRRGSLVHSICGASLVEVQQAAPGTLQPTFPTGFPVLCLDYIYVNSNVTVLSAEVVANSLTQLASDHFPVAAELTPSDAGGPVVQG